MCILQQNDGVGNIVQIVAFVVIENAESARQIIAGDIDNYIEHFCK